MQILDLHVHTVYSGDSTCEVENAILSAKAKGLDGIAITDHDSVAGLEEAREFARDKDFLVIPGIEVSSKDGHILGLGIEKTVPQGLPADSTVNKIRDQGGVAIAAHPFSVNLRPLSPLKSDFDAIEVFNSRRYIGNRLTKKYVDHNHIPATAGSDAHFCDEIGLAGVRIDANLKVNDILDEIKRGNAIVFGQYLSVSNYLRKVIFKFFA